MTDSEDILSELPSEDSQREWYLEYDPSYAPRWGSTPLSLEENELLDRQARRLVGHWLEQDNHGFRVPGNDWGQDLLWSLRRLMAATNTFRKVTVTLDTSPWSDGFEYAAYPWLEFYTDRNDWVDGLPKTLERPTIEPHALQTFNLTVTTVTSNALLSDATPRRWRAENPLGAAEEISRGFERFPGFISGTDEELAAVLEKRLSEWD